MPLPEPVGRTHSAGFHVELVWFRFSLQQFASASSLDVVKRGNITNTRIILIYIVTIVRIIAINVVSGLSSTFPFPYVVCIASSYLPCYR